VCDDGVPQACDEATVYISIDPNSGGNEILAVDDINDTFVNIPVDGDVSTNDLNVDGPVGTEVFTLVNGPSEGTLVFNTDGTYTYTPNLDYVGEDTFEYQVCDGGNPIACDTAIVYIEVVGDPIIGNDPPVANADTNITEVGVPISGNVLSNDFDPDGDPIIITVNTDPSNGTVVINPTTGEYTYTPNPGFQGEDTFEYTICDDGTPALCDTTTVTIQVIPDDGNITVANDDAYYGEVDTDITGNILENDSDPEGHTQQVDTTISPVSGPSSGTVVILANGDFIYTPNPGFVGTDQFVYQIFDSGSPIATDVATVYILINETPAPSIALVKTGAFNDINGDGCADVDETITYTFSVTNEGNVPLGSIIVTDPLLEAPNPVVPIVFVSGDDNANLLLDETETWIYTADYTITQADIDTGNVTNQATVEGTDDDGTVVSDLSDDNSVLEDDPTVTDLCQEGSIAIIKEGTFNDLNGDGCADVDETITYAFTIVNTGNVTLTDVMITDNLVGLVLVGGPITLAPGETDTTTFVGTYPITQTDIDAGSVTNQATVEGAEPNGTIVSDLSDDDSILEDDPTVTDLCQEGSIAIIKEGTFNDLNGDACADVDETITYAFTVVNTGNVTLTDVMITDNLVGLVLVGGPITLAPGETDATTFVGTYPITQTDIDAGSVTNQATVEGTEPSGTIVSDLSDDDSILEDDPTVTDLCQEAEIALIKVGTVIDTNGDGCADVGETIRYTFDVYNLGNVTLTDIDITDDLPGISIAGGPITLAPGTNDATSFVGIYTITQDDIDTGSVTNQATVEGTDPNGVVVSDLSDDNSILEDDPTVTPVCQIISIALIKTGTLSDDNGNDCFDVGETIVYSFLVTNLSNVPLTNITITDPLVTVVGGPIVLAAGDSDGTTFTAVYTITQDDIDTGSVTNQATVSGTAPSGSVVIDQSDDNSNFEDDPTVTVSCGSNADMSVTKTGVFNDENNDGATQVGETISYIFSVTNTGNVTLYNITLEDPLPGIVISGGPIVELAPGETDDTTFTAIYTVTQDDIDAQEVLNQAIATGQDPNGNDVSDESDDPNDPTNVDPDNDGDPDDVTITILPNVLPGDFEIFNGITPDGDGKNDFFYIKEISKYSDNTMEIFNRWGVLVYETTNYGGSNDEENVFTGISEGRVTIAEDDLLPTGTYYYVLKFTGQNPGELGSYPEAGKESYAGYLYINR
ncbi:DUF7507 domain-containing protein, partial [Ulvibacter litoralis]